MRILIISILIAVLTAMPVEALDFTAPEVPEAGEYYMPESTDSFSDGLWYILRTGIRTIRPDIAQAGKLCMTVIAITILISVVTNVYTPASAISELIGVIAVSTTLLSGTNTLISLGAETITELSQYEKLLLPVMSAAVAAQGGATTSAALYAGTILFNTILSTVITKFLIPFLYVYLCLSIISRGIQQNRIENLQKTSKNAAVWLLKTTLYIFTGYMTITDVISGTTDAATLRATKLTISGTVPVVGNILADASEAVIVSAGVLKNAAGVYGLLAILAICIGPFLSIGIHYLMLKLSAGICEIIGGGKSAELLKDFSTAMGLVLAMVGTQCLLLLISTVCFMKGVGI